MTCVYQVRQLYLVLENKRFPVGLLIRRRRVCEICYWNRSPLWSPDKKINYKNKYFLWARLDLHKSAMLL